MKTQKIYQIDAFTDTLFGGNPAAVCILPEWLPEDVMQDIAAENNLAETAFAVLQNHIYQLRWFTPELEEDLCGHATLATAYTLFEYYNHPTNTIQFISPRSGELSVTKNANGSMTMDFPIDQIAKIEKVAAITEAIGLNPIEMYKGKTDYMLVYENQGQIESISPNFNLLHQLDCRGVIVTARGNHVDFVSRFFAPQCGIPEDPVTGSAHTTLSPYWSTVLGKKTMTAAQLSKRSGTLTCTLQESRVLITGNAVCYMVGELYL